MDIDELLQNYQSIGVKLWVESGKLKFKAPSGVMTQKHKEELKKYKDAIISYLMYEDESVLVSDYKNKFSIFPLSDIQTAYLMGRSEKKLYGGVSCHAYGELQLPVIDIQRMTDAWHKVILRHDMLRAVVYEEGYQQVLKEVELPVIKSKYVDEKEKFKQQVLKVREELMYKQYSIGSWPMYEIKFTMCKEFSILHFSVDMLIADFPSIHIILNELLGAYKNPNEELEELNVTFRDVLLYKQAIKNSYKNKIKYENDKKYWLDRIKSFPEPPILPIKKNVNINNNFEIEQYSYQISQDDWNMFKENISGLRITPSSALLTSYGAVISRWSENKKFLINVTRLDRQNYHSDVWKIVGDFTDVDVFEMDYSNKLGFINQIKSVQNCLWNDLGHAEFSGVKVLRELSKLRGNQVIVPIVYTSTIGVEGSRNDGVIKINYEISQTPQVLIDCQVSERAGGVFINWDVRKGMLADFVVKDMFSSFISLINQMIRGNDVWQKEEVVCLPNHTENVRNEVNNVKSILEYENILDGFISNLKVNPNKTALITNGVEYSYKELAQYASTVKEILFENGCKKGDYIAISLKKGLEQIASVIGVLMIGGIYVPLLYNQPTIRKNKILTQGDIHYIIQDHFEKSEYDSDSIKTILVSNIQYSNVEKIDFDKASANQPAYVIFTSGSTGIPKGVIISHKAAMNTILDINKKFNISKDDSILGIADLSFDLSVYDIFGTFAAGGTLVLPNNENNRNPENWLKLIEKYNVTIWNSVPANMQMLFSAAGENRKLNIRIVMLSGDWIPNDLPDKIYSICPNVNIYSLGGATEAGIWSIYHLITRNDCENVSIPYGIPLANQYFHVYDSNMRSCPDYVPGELYIGGNSLACGYLNNEEQTKENFIIHPVTGECLYRTGDYGKYIKDGIIEFLGRKDTQVKINGHRIELSEIENVLKNYEKIDDAIVVMSEKKSEYFLNAFVTARENSNKLENNKINDAIAYSCTKIGAKLLEKIDSKLLLRWISLSETIALLNVMDAFRNAGLFIDDIKSYSFEEIYNVLGVIPKYKRILRRMLRGLIKEGFIKEEYSEYISTNNFFEYDINTLKNELVDVEEKIHNCTALVKYLTSKENLITKVLCGDIKPVDLIFPEGKLENALEAYQDNLIAKNINSTVIEGIRSLIEKSENKDKPIRILEIGAGVGGTSRELISKISSYNVEYYFTDISTFFLNEAKKVFNQYDWIRYSLFDMNENFNKQGINENSMDIIICANCLHNALDGETVLKKLSKILVPNGHLFIADCVNELYSLMISMGFEYTAYVKDYRSENDEAFFDYNHWMKNFSSSGLNVIYEYPDKKNPISASQQHIFIVNKLSNKIKMYDTEILEYAKENLPKYMIPSSAEVIDEIPLTSNGKRDSKVLMKRVEAYSLSHENSYEMPKGEIEEKIAAIWRSALDNDQISRNENFFSVGGDSLIIAQIVGVLKKQFEEFSEMTWNEVLSVVLNYPTIVGIADYIKAIDSHMKLTIDNRCDYKILKEEQSGRNDTEIVLFADGTGTLSIYKEILPMIKGLRFDSVRISGVSVENAKEYTLIEVQQLVLKLAEKYAAYLKKGTAKKLILIGHCFGGLVALEVARILSKEGKKIEVIMIDSKIGRSFIKNSLLLERGFAVILSADLQKAGHVVNEITLKNAISEFIKEKACLPSEDELCRFSGRYNEVGECYSELRKLSQEDRFRKIYSSVLGSRMSDVSESELNHFKDFYNVFCHSYESVTKYIPEVYYGDVYMLSCKDKSTAFLPLDDIDSTNFVIDIVKKGLKVIPIEGNHVSCMFGENCKAVFQILKEIIGEAINEK